MMQLLIPILLDYYIEINERMWHKSSKNAMLIHTRVSMAFYKSFTTFAPESEKRNPLPNWCTFYTAG